MEGIALVLYGIGVACFAVPAGALAMWVILRKGNEGALLVQGGDTLDIVVNGNSRHCRVMDVYPRTIKATTVVELPWEGVGIA